MITSEPIVLNVKTVDLSDEQFYQRISLVMESSI